MTAGHVVDAFVRADTASNLGTAPTGHVWSVGAGTFRINNNQAQMTVTGLPAIATVLVETPTNPPVSWAGGFIEATLISTDAGAIGSKQGVVVQASSISPVTFIVADRTELYHVTGGVKTLLDTHSSSFVDGDRIRLAASGNTIRCWKNGTLVSEATNAAMGAGFGRGRVGLIFNGSPLTGSGEVRWGNVNIGSDVAGGGWTVGRIGVVKGGTGSLPPVYRGTLNRRENSNICTYNPSLFSPLSVQEGDIILFGGVWSSAVTVTPPSGWILHHNAVVGSARFTVYSKIAGVGEVSQNFTASGSDRFTGTFSAYGPTSGINASGISTAASSLDGTIPSLTPSIISCLLAGLFLGEATPNTELVLPSDLTFRANATAADVWNQLFILGDQLRSNTSATGIKTATGTGNSGGRVGWGVLLNPQQPSIPLPRFHTFKAGAVIKTNPSGSPTVTVNAPWGATGFIDVVAIALDTTYGTISHTSGGYTERARTSGHGVEISLWTRPSNTTNGVWACSITPPGSAFAVMLAVGISDNMTTYEAGAVTVAGSGTTCIAPSLTPSGSNRELLNFVFGKPTTTSSFVPLDGIDQWASSGGGAFDMGFGMVRWESSSATGTRTWQDGAAASHSNNAAASILLAV